jgi:integrase
MTKAKKIILKSGIKWEVYFAVDGRNSKRIRRRFNRKIDADLFIKSFTTDSFNKLPDVKIEKTLLSESEYWLRIRGGEVSASHLIRFEGILKSLLKKFPQLRISEIDHLFLASLREDLLNDGLTPATVNRWTNVLTTISNFSFKSKRIPSNPSLGFGLLNEFRGEMVFWEKDSVSQFLGFCKNKYKTEQYWVYVVYLLALNTGLRAGEIWGLKVSDINLQRSFISIERQLLKVNRKLAPTKGKNIRKVPCNPELGKELLKMINEQNLQYSDFLFQTNSGTPIRHNNFTRRFFTIDVQLSGVQSVRFHDMRHTALTLMVESGINLKIVQSIAGHAEIKTTMKYVHLLANSIENVAKSFSLSS